MAYSRENPSPRYKELLALYKSMHDEGEVARGRKPEDTYQGISLIEQVDKIAWLIKQCSAKTVLDYGCGKGMLYRPEARMKMNDGRQLHLTEIWKIPRESITLYDAGYELYSAFPTAKSDLVISTDVLEHIPEEDISWLLDTFFSLSNKMVFANIASYPAKAILPNGENAHCTIKPAPWWQERISAVAANHPDIQFVFEVKQPAADGTFRPVTLTNLKKPA